MAPAITGWFSRRARCRWRFAAAALLCLCAASAPRAGAQPAREYDLKAVLMLNFVQFVEWPGTAFAADDAPFVIGILGGDPFGKVLERLVADERAGKRRIEVRHFHSVSEVHECQMLFVCENERNDLPRIFAALKNRPVLTVGDFEGFALRGGMMRLLRNADGKIQLRINLDAVKAGGLTVSAKLLRVAEVITSGG